MPQGLELKVPPLVLVGATLALMWLAARAVANLGFFLPYRTYISGGIAALGALCVLLGIVSFKRAKTTVNPMKPETVSSLVVSGIYRVSRNPMYLGFLLILLGGAVYVSNVLAFILIPAFILYMNRFQIEPEEAALHSRFGTEFASYKSKVRRWI